MQITTITTEKDNIRSDAVAWGNIEDTHLYKVAVSEHIDSYHKYNIPVGLVRAYHKSYPNVFCALADGFKLLAPPVKSEDGLYDWWLVKE